MKKKYLCLFLYSPYVPHNTYYVVLFFWQYKTKSQKNGDSYHALYFCAIMFHYIFIFCTVDFVWFSLFLSCSTFWLLQNQKRMHFLWPDPSTMFFHIRSEYPHKQAFHPYYKYMFLLFEMSLFQLRFLPFLFLSPILSILTLSYMHLFQNHFDLIGIWGSKKCRLTRHFSESESYI